MLAITMIRRVSMLSVLLVLSCAQLVVAEDSSPRLLVVNGGLEGEQAHDVDRSLVIMDPLANKILGRIPLAGGMTRGVQPHVVAASPDGKLAFVTLIDLGESSQGQVPSGTIAVIDIANRKELPRIEVGPYSLPHGIVFAGGKVYFTVEGYKLVGRYDPKSNRIDWMQGHGELRSHELVTNQSATRIFTTNSGSNSVVAMELDSSNRDSKSASPTALASPVPEDWSITRISVGKAPEGIAMSPDEKEVWTTNRGDDTLSVVDTTTKKVKETLQIKAKEPYRVGFTLDGTKVFVCTRDTGEVVVIDAATRKEIKRLSDVGARLHGVLMSPDGSRAYIAFKGNETTPSPKNVAIIDLKKLEVIGYLTTGERPESLAWANTK